MFQGCTKWTETLSNVLDNCPQLHTLDISSLQSVISDSFLADVCERAVELRCLAIHLGPGKPEGPHKQEGLCKLVSCDLLTAVVRACPSLAQLYLTIRSDGGKTDTADAELVDTVVDAVRQYHGGHCHRRDVCLLSGNCHQIQLSFTPLKLLSAVASCPYTALS